MSSNRRHLDPSSDEYKRLINTPISQQGDGSGILSDEEREAVEYFLAELDEPDTTPRNTTC